MSSARGSATLSRLWTLLVDADQVDAGGITPRNAGDLLFELARCGHAPRRTILREWPRPTFLEFLPALRRDLARHDELWAAVRLGGGSGRWRLFTPDGLSNLADPINPTTHQVDAEIDLHATVREYVSWGG